ncbi:uncharacterized protein LOC126839039 [Adelges cooleyi]|uniref:uncharacterized protein LOC126839039 n=1 Tax=Adelges cooleyi TaxID=133065 RepID=UPI00217F2E8C|nr:uncharacterized protein LOC126839039 [Adelges cooleyi]
MESSILPTRTYVNGGYLQKSIGKPVTLIASVLKISGDGKSLTLQTTDNQVVTANFHEPVYSKVDALVEIHGYVSDKTTINGTYHISFPSNITNDFDLNNFDETMKLINNLSNPLR